MNLGYSHLKGKTTVAVGLLWRVVFYEQNGRFKALLKGARRWLEAWRCLKNGEDAIGNAPSQDEIKLAKESCPICYDGLKTPLKLNCSHIFCEKCIYLWFDKEASCPMCRVKIPKLAWCDGSTLKDVVYR